MNSARILWRTVLVVGAQGIFAGYVVFLAVVCGVLCLLEPETFPSYGTAVWYCFQTITTIGFGDTVPTGFACRVLTMAVGLSSLFVVALITGVVVSFYNEKIKLLRKQSFLEFGRQMERLTELSREELEELEERYRVFVGESRKGR